MNGTDQIDVPPPIAPNVASFQPPDPPPARPLSWWLRKFFACNPFYLVSAALLLYGCYRISIDTTLLHDETARLLFSFSSVQAYEVLLVLVAIFLARRRLWYDSTLLVGLENLLVFVPFILISQAALTSDGITAAVCGTGVALAVLRFGSLKKFYTELYLPNRLLAVGLALLAVNVALPLLYRHYINVKLGVHLESGPDWVMNECNWLLVLPAALALANFLPREQAMEDWLPQRRWLPAGMFALWFAVTCAHLYGLDYVYGYDLRPELCAPAAWALAWTVLLRWPAHWPRLKCALMFPPLLAPLLAADPANKTFLILNALNVAAFGGWALSKVRNRLAVHLAYGSALLLVAGLPEVWMQHWVHGLTPAQGVAAGLAGYVIFWTAWLRHPKLAVAGAIVLGVTIGVGLESTLPGAGHWALQGALVFFLLHSLRWNDAEHPGAEATRLLAGAAWAMHAFVWMNSEGGRLWMPVIPALGVLGIYCACLPLRGIWRLFVVPTAALLVLISGPCSAAVNGLRAAPAGLLAVIASFVLLGAGTIAALTRDTWHKQ
jgi:hypothetical protein